VRAGGTTAGPSFAMSWRDLVYRLDRLAVATVAEVISQHSRRTKPIEIDYESNK